jgi:hypothetical protein
MGVSLRLRGLQRAGACRGAAQHALAADGEQVTGSQDGQSAPLFNALDVVQDSSRLQDAPPLPAPDLR